VELATAAERQALVAGVTDERVAEPHAPRGIGVDEAAKPLPERIVELHLVAQRDGQLRRVEARAKYGGVAEHRPVGRREAIDVRGDDRLDRVRQRIRRPGRANRVEQLEEEQHIAVGAPRDLLDVMGGKGMLVGGDPDDLGQMPFGER
jgi:hypothetical protein